MKLLSSRCAVENVDKDMLVANKKTDDSVKQILAIARKYNVKPEDVQTSQISVQPKYNTDDMEYEARRGVKRVLIGYQVSKTVAVRLRDISRFDEMLADILKAGITRLSNLEFRDSQLRKHRDEARRMAIRAAQGESDVAGRRDWPINWPGLFDYGNIRQRLRPQQRYAKRRESLPATLPPAIPRSRRELFQLPRK